MSVVNDYHMHIKTLDFRARGNVNNVFIVWSHEKRKRRNSHIQDFTRLDSKEIIAIHSRKNIILYYIISINVLQDSANTSLN